MLFCINIAIINLTILIFFSILSDVIIRYSVAQPSNGAFGARLNNGSWSGMIGMISKKAI